MFINKERVIQDKKLQWDGSAKLVSVIPNSFGDHYPERTKNKYKLNGKGLKAFLTKNQNTR